MDTLTSLRVFCAVAELKSFTAAANRLGLSSAMTSRHVMHLETRLGSRLFNRTSRHVSMTETGTLYLNQARQMLDGLDEVEAAISNVTVTPRGTLKLSAPVWIANSLVARTIGEYHQRYPEVCLDMDFSGRIVNLVDEGFDLALRATAPERLDPGLIARPLTKIVFHAVGSPAYLARSSRPAELAELNGHSLLLYSGVNSNGNLAFDGPEGRETVKFRTVMQSENETMLHLAAIEGMGLAFLPTLMIQPDIAEGRLEMVLPESVNFDATLYAVYPSRKHLSAKVRTFIDFLSSRPFPSPGV
ncbi:LysR family transcriptional regulator [Xanthomonas arboricola]|nr:LysR family transcriptional regulator [Xanthomonas arboricola]MDN0209272.1 LysR substrate-binding domain-containing protein [Xanthomonas arboricola pv. corylina]MDN0213643.1 LysR substrate-binding domain-containing protein [Xanthomonas arboricola pv. corylina]QUI82639.1 LysR family transcriptional regulator [Xanthomonas arboricola pv. corylina]UQQ12693.1 LysR family transcriptional regulator [Xanthomonas arboricola pv. corylina]